MRVCTYAVVAVAVVYIAGVQLPSPIQASAMQLLGGSAVESALEANAAAGDGNAAQNDIQARAGKLTTSPCSKYSSFEFIA